MVKTYTIKARNDGFGAQYQAFMSGIAYCMYKNYIYIHSPMLNLTNNEDVKSLNNFIGIPIKENKKDNNIDIIEKYSSDVHYSNFPSKFYTKKCICLLRKYYYSSPKPIINQIDIAIHIRRGDVSFEIEKKRKRYTNNDYYNKIIQYMNTNYPDYKITIFSEGKMKDFHTIKGNNISFELNVNIEKTFHSLVCAKILVTAKSSFSYCAAILNSNKIYYMNFWHKPLNHWLNIEDYVLNENENEN